jgi:hypothetical protein
VLAESISTHERNGLARSGYKCRKAAVGDDEDTLQSNCNCEADEKFEERIRKGHPAQPDAIETLIDDHVLISVCGQYVTEAIDVPVLRR